MRGGNNKENVPIHVLNGSMCGENCLTSFSTHLLLSILMLPQQNKATMQFCFPHRQTLPTCIAAAATPWLSPAAAGSSAVRVVSVCAPDPAGVCACAEVLLVRNPTKVNWMHVLKVHHTYECSSLGMMPADK